MSNFNQLIEDVKFTSKLLDQHPIFIGGIATYFYSIEKDLEPETTHDADFFISYGDVQDVEDLHGPISHNARLRKPEVVINNNSYDIYLEDQSDLIYSYQELFKHSNVIDAVRVPCVEHLIGLKLQAFKDRKNSEKGSKDARDLFKLSLLLAKKNREKGILKEILLEDKFELPFLIEFYNDFENKKFENEFNSSFDDWMKRKLIRIQIKDLNTLFKDLLKNKLDLENKNISLTKKFKP